MGAETLLTLLLSLLGDCFLALTAKGIFDKKDKYTMTHGHKISRPCHAGRT